MFSCSACRLIQVSNSSAEEVLPPTIQNLMKGYNKYLRPFFGSMKANNLFHTHTINTSRYKKCVFFLKATKFNTKIYSCVVGQQVLRM